MSPLGARAVAVAAALALALAFRGGPSLDSGATKRLLLGVVAVALALALPRRLRVPAGGPFLLAFVGWSLSSIAIHPHPGATPVAVAFAASTVIAVAVAARGLGFARRVAVVAQFSLGVLVAGHVLVSFARGARGLAVEGAQGNPNWAGLVLAVCLAASLEVVRRTRGAGRVGAGAGVVTMGVALGLTHARVAWVALAVAAAVVLVAHRRGAGARLRAAALGVAALATVLGALTARTQGAPIHRRAAAHALALTVDPYEAPAELAVAGRLAIARTGLSAALTHAPLGVGLGGFSSAYLEAQGEELATLSPAKAARRFVAAETAHDDWVQVLVETGPVGLALLLVGAVLVVRAQRNPGLRAALIVLGVGACGDAPLRIPALVGLFALLVAASPHHGRRLRVRHERWLAVAAAALTLAFALRGRVVDALVAEAESEPGRRVALLSRAVRLDPWSPTATLRLGVARLDDGDAEAAIELLRRARRLERSVAVELALAGAFSRAGDPAAAEVAAQAALALHHGSFRGWIDLASLLAARGALPEATRALEAARSIQPHHPLVEATRAALLDATLREVDLGARLLP